MTDEQITFLALIKKLNYEKGVFDCAHGLKPQSQGKSYIDGYSDEYAKQQQQSQGGFN